MQSETESNKCGAPVFVSGSEPVAPEGAIEETGSDDELAPADEELAVLLSEGLTHVAAAESVGVSSKTVQRRLKNPAFRSMVSQLRRDRLAATTGRLVRMSDSALDTLEQLLVSDDERLRFQAAKVVLDLGRRQHREDVMEGDLTDRVDAVERFMTEVAEVMNEIA